MKLRLNEASVLIAAFVFITPVLFGNSSVLFMTMLALALLFLLVHRNPINPLLLKLLAFLLIPTLSVFVTALVNTADKEQTQVLYRLGNIVIYTAAWENAIRLTVRSFCMSMISLTYVTSIQYNKLVVSLMQNFKLHTHIGYSLLAAFNAFYHLKDEYKRIRLINKQRFGKKTKSIKLIFPLLVSAGRYSSQAGLSLSSRGLNQDKTFLLEVKWKLVDTLYIMSALVVTVVVPLLLGGR